MPQNCRKQPATGSYFGVILGKNAVLVLWYDSFLWNDIQSFGFFNGLGAAFYVHFFEQV